MSRIASIAVGNKVDVSGTGLEVSESCIAIQLQDGSLHTFNAQGQPVKSFTVDNENEAVAPHKVFAIIGNRLIVGKGRSSGEVGVTGGRLEVIDVMTR